MELSPPLSIKGPTDTNLKVPLLLSLPCFPLKKARHGAALVLRRTLSLGLCSASMCSGPAACFPAAFQVPLHRWASSTTKEKGEEMPLPWSLQDIPPNDFRGY